LRNYHAARRFEIVAADVVGISPTAVHSAKKGLRICDQFTRFVVVVPIEDESSAKVARALLQYSILLLSAPERLLSDNGPNFCGEVIKHLSAATGIK
jgi:Integrase core domain